MPVLIPCDAIEAEKATLAAAELPGPVYIRFGREKSPIITTQETPFSVGRAEIFRDGKNATIVAAGMLLYNALMAAEELSREGIEIRVINNHTLKPMDTETVIAAAKETGAIVTVEEHQIHGGLGSAVAEIVTQNHPVPMEFIGVKDRFGESGEPFELIEKFGLGTESIKEAVRKVLRRKKIAS